MITFSGNATCTAANRPPSVACPIEILVDGQKTGKINFAPATAEPPAPAFLVHSVDPDDGAAERRPHRRRPVRRLLEK